MEPELATVKDLNQKSRLRNRKYIGDVFKHGTLQVSTSIQRTQQSIHTV